MPVYRFGPARLLSAAAITDVPELWTDHGKTRGSIAVPVDIRMATGSLDQDGRTPRADALYRVGIAGSVKAPITDQALAQLLRAIPGSVLVTASGKTALGLGSTPGLLTPRAIAVVPEDEYVSGGAWWGSAYCVWFPAGVIKLVGEMAQALPDEGDLFAGASPQVEVSSLGQAGGLSAGLKDAGGIGPIWITGQKVLAGPDFLFEVGADTGVTPLFGGAGAFTRASAATHRHATTKVLTAATTNTPRVEPGGLLIEMGRTNAIGAEAEDLTAANYIKSGSTVSGNATTGPDGAATADKIVESVVNETHGVQRVLVGATDNLVQACSIFVKAAERSWARVASLDKANVAADSWVNLATGVVGTKAAAHTIQTEEYASGWWRIKLAFNVGTGGTSPRLRLWLATGDGVTAYAGDGASGIYSVGWQHEVDGIFSTSYMPPATPTRSPDALSFGFSQALDTTYGVAAQMEFGPLHAEGQSSVGYVALSVGSPADPRLQLRHGPTNSWEVLVDSGAVENSGALVGDSLPLGSPAEVTLCWGPTPTKKWVAYVGDTEVTPAAAATAVPPAGNWGGQTIYVGGMPAGSGDTYANNTGAMHLRRLAIVRGSARTPAQLRGLKRG